jgi:GH24 family phage-related lysozyme (muramidase)
MIRLKNLLTESIETDPAFVDYIVSVEGTGPGSSPETGHKAYKDSVGVWTIGYGHAATSDPKVKPGLKISDAKAKQLLKTDLAKAEQIVKDHIAKNFPGKKLDQIQLKMLTDFAFNGGQRMLAKFPKFTAAVVNKDWKTASQSYKRYGGSKELTDRNTKFYNTFLKPLLSKTKSTQPKPKPFKTGVDWMDNALKGDTYIHVVKPGDTLLAIALKHGLSLDVIMGMNGLINSDIKVGQKIKLK